MRTTVLAVAVSVSTLAVVMGACGGDDTGTSPGDGGKDAIGPGDGSNMDTSVDSGSDGGTESAADTGSDATSGTSFCDGTIGVLVAAFESCCSAQDKATQEFMSLDMVLQEFKGTCEMQLQASVTKARVTIDGTAASQCEQAVQMLAANGFCWSALDNNKQSSPIFGSAPCNGVVAGLVDAGQPCAQSYECKDGLTCVGWSPSADGVCQAPGAAGSACSYAADAGAIIPFDYGFGNHPDCAAGNFCSGSTCKAQGASGANCGLDTECVTGLTCHLGKCGSGTPSGMGGPCVDAFDCQSGLYCAPGDGGAQGTCQMREAAGGACTQSGNECKGYCAPPDSGTTGTCAAICGSG